MSIRATIGLAAVLLTSTAASAHAGPPIPQAFRSLKPYQVVEQIMAQRDALGLTDEQFARLDNLSLTIRNEKHRFIHQGGKPHVTRHVTMVSRQQAYEKALAVLTPFQQERMQTLFPVPGPEVRAPRKYTAPHGKP